MFFIIVFIRKNIKICEIIFYFTNILILNNQKCIPTTTNRNKTYTFCLYY